MSRRAPYGEGRVVVVTGGAGGIGSEVCRMLAERGARLAVVDLRGEAAHALAEALPARAAAGAASWHRGYGCDLTDRAQVERLVARLEEDFGRVDVLVNNVGMTSSDRFDERSVESIEHELAVNLLSPLVLTRLLVDALRRSDDARVVTTCSLGGIFPLGETPIYTASKFGLRGAMLSIALDLAPKGIRVGSVLPAATDTPMLRQEAVEGGNSLQFQDPPQTTSHVARAVVRLLDRPRLEIYPKTGESWLVRVVMLSPNLLPRLLPLFRKKGERGLARYIAQQRRTGGIVEVDGELRVAGR